MFPLLQANYIQGKNVINKSFEQWNNLSKLSMVATTAVLRNEKFEIREVIILIFHE